MARSRLSEPLPWYQWNPQQWQASRKVARMDWAARGMYRELMDECWIKGRIPSTAEGIAELLDIDAQEVAPLLPQFIRCFDVHEDGTMSSPFIEAIRTESDARRIAQANRRLGKDKHGNPKPTEPIPDDPRITADNQGEVVQERRVEESRGETPLPPKGTGREVPPLVQEWHGRLRGLWPKTQPDGKAAPGSSRAETEKRFASIVRAGTATPEELAWAGHLYVQQKKHDAHYVVSLETFLGPKRIYEEFLEGARAEMTRRAQ